MWAEARIPDLRCTHQGLRIARRCVKHKRAGDLEERNSRHTKDLNRCGKDRESTVKHDSLGPGHISEGAFSGWSKVKVFVSQSPKVFWLRPSMMRLSALLAVCDSALKYEGVKASEIMMNGNKMKWMGQLNTILGTCTMNLKCSDSIRPDTACSAKGWWLWNMLAYAIPWNMHQFGHGNRGWGFY